MIPIKNLSSVGVDMDIYFDVVIDFDSTEIQFFSILSIDKDGKVDCREFKIESINKIDEKTLETWGDKVQENIERIELWVKTYGPPIAKKIFEKILEDVLDQI